jgi:hypothetical protein
MDSFLAGANTGEKLAKTMEKKGKNAPSRPMATVVLGHDIPLPLVTCFTMDDTQNLLAGEKS